MKTLFIVNDPPYGAERVFNALRLAHALLKHDEAAEVCDFLMADAVVGARRGQKTPDGYYNVERMLKRVRAGKGRILLCGDRHLCGTGRRCVALRAGVPFAAAGAGG